MLHEALTYQQTLVALSGIIDTILRNNKQENFPTRGTWGGFMRELNGSNVLWLHVHAGI